MLKLNLGCGHTFKQGFINIDIIDLGQEKVIDALRGLPFNDEHFDLVVADYFFEHFSDGYDLSFIFKECWRVLKYGGELSFIVPHYTHPSAYSAGHKSFWNDYKIDTIIGNADPLYQYGTWIKGSLHCNSSTINVKLIKGGFLHGS